MYSKYQPSLIDLPSCQILIFFKSPMIGPFSSSSTKLFGANFNSLLKLGPLSSVDSHVPAVPNNLNQTFFFRGKIRFFTKIISLFRLAPVKVNINTYSRISSSVWTWPRFNKKLVFCLYFGLELIFFVFLKQLHRVYVRF